MPDHGPPRFLAADADPASARAAVIGLPYDGTASYRPGARFGPAALRRASDALETYDPPLDADLEDYKIADLGDLPLPAGPPEPALDAIRRALEALPPELLLLGLGGEHTVTLPLVEHALASNGDAAVLLFDAHTDLREEYEGSRYSHACTVRRLLDAVGPDRIAMIGVRSGTRGEFALAREHNLLLPVDAHLLLRRLESWGGRPLYLSFDLDGFDPADLPGTGVVEPGGFHWREIEPLLTALKGRRVIGADVVELAPGFDPSGRSEVLAARVARALLLLMLTGG